MSTVPRLVLTPTLGRQAEPDEGHPGLDDRAVAMAEAADAAPAPTDAGVHEVRPGDSLWKIARQYGLSVEEYRSRNLLGVEVTSADVARACVALCGPAFAKTTGAQIPVDGANPRVI